MLSRVNSSHLSKGVAWNLSFKFQSPQAQFYIQFNVELPTFYRRPRVEAVQQSSVFRKIVHTANVDNCDTKNEEET